MKAAILSAPNELSVRQTADPVAGSGDLVLKIRAATICGTDIRIFLCGRKTAGVRYPSIIGHEFSSGEVVEASKGSAFAVGQRVVVSAQPSPVVIASNASAGWKICARESAGDRI